MLDKYNIIQKFSTLYTYKQNEIIKYQNFIIINNVKIILKNAKLSFFLQSEISFIVIYLKNRNLATRLRIQYITLEKIYTTIKLNFNYYRIIKYNV